MTGVYYMEKIERLTLGLKDSDREANASRLDHVFTLLSEALSNTLILSMLVKGKSIGDVYQRRLDATWEHIKRLGMRIAQLGREPNMNPRRRQAGESVPNSRDVNLISLVRADLEREDGICSEIRKLIRVIQAGDDWSSVALLVEILIHREELVHQLENFLDDPVLEHIWEEDMKMEGKKSKASTPMH